VPKEVEIATTHDTQRKDKTSRTLFDIYMEIRNDLKKEKFF